MKDNGIDKAIFVKLGSLCMCAGNIPQIVGVHVFFFFFFLLCFLLRLVVEMRGEEEEEENLSYEFAGLSSSCTQSIRLLTH